MRSLFSTKTLKAHPSLIPLVVCVGAGAALAAGICYRLATKSPEVSWRKGKTTEPYERYRNEQYKLYSPNIDYSKLVCEAPEYKKGFEEKK